jgi:hypothetical protein
VSKQAYIKTTASDQTDTEIYREVTDARVTQVATEIRVSGRVRRCRPGGGVPQARGGMFGSSVTPAARSAAVARVNWHRFAARRYVRWPDDLVLLATVIAMSLMPRSGRAPSPTIAGEPARFSAVRGAVDTAGSRRYRLSWSSAGRAHEL